MLFWQRSLALSSPEQWFRTGGPACLRTKLRWNSIRPTPGQTAFWSACWRSPGRFVVVSLISTHVSHMSIWLTHIEWWSGIFVVADNGKYELCDVDQIECLKDLENTLRQVSAAASINQVPQNVAQVMKDNNINCSCPSGIRLSYVIHGLYDG